MPITLNDDARKQALASLRRFVDQQLDGEQGDLQLELLLDYVLAEIGPSIRNEAISDAQVYLRDRLSDLEGALFEPEFEYWNRGGRRGR